MIDPVRVLRPLDDERASIDRLASYETSADLAAALGATWAAVERSLRQWLRNDAGVSDDLRMSALSAADLPVDRLIPALSRHNLVSLRLAGLMHQLEQTARRAERGDVRAADADAALATVAQLRAEVAAIAATTGAAVARPAETGTEWIAPAHAEVPRRSRFRVVVLVGLAAVAGALLLMMRGGNPRDEAIRAFEAGQLGVAEAAFRRAIEADAQEVTARLYLGRIFRTQGRYEEAANVLHDASGIAPRDPGVRRELGHLFLDLGRPDAAAAQFRLAQEIEPDNKLNWIGLILALRAAGDPEAENVLRRAPADVRAELTSRSQRPDTL